MKNWLRQRLLNLLLGSEAEIHVTPKLRRGRDKISLCDEEDIDGGIDLSDPINFRVQSVSGGTIIESRWYDHKKDENRVKLHIVTPDENLAESIGKIVTMELLQK
jgi:hypothetical protein